MHTGVWDGQIVLSFWGKDLWYDRHTHTTRTFWNPGVICLNGNSEFFPVMTKHATEHLWSFQKSCSPSVSAFSFLSFVPCPSQEGENWENNIPHHSQWNKGLSNGDFLRTAWHFTWWLYSSRKRREIHRLWQKQVYTGGNSNLEKWHVDAHAASHRQQTCEHRDGVCADMWGSV